MSKKVEHVDARTLHDWIAKGEAIVIDVREPHEYLRAHIPGSLQLPLSRLGAQELPAAEGRKVVVSCASGMRSLMAADRVLAAHYGTVYNLHGGLSGWQSAGFEVARDEQAAAQGLFPNLFAMFRNAG